MREERDCENKCECVLTDELLRRLQQIFDVEDEETAIGFIEKDNITGILACKYSCTHDCTGM